MIEKTAFLFAAYILGSVPFGLYLSKLFGAGDIRQKGSGNTGATNAARVGGAKLGAVTLLFDAGKAILAICFAQQLFGAEFGYYTFLAVVLGHCYSVFLKFGGGKGVATLFGGLFASNWMLGLLAAVTWLMVYFITKISGLSALCMLFVTACAGFFILSQTGYIVIVILAIIITIRHKKNIQLLVKGENNG